MGSSSRQDKSGAARGEGGKIFDFLMGIVYGKGKVGEKSQSCWPGLGRRGGGRMGRKKRGEEIGWGSYFGN